MLEISISNIGYKVIKKFLNSWKIFFCKSSMQSRSMFYDQMTWNRYFCFYSFSASVLTNRLTDVNACFYLKIQPFCKLELNYTFNIFLYIFSSGFFSNNMEKKFKKLLWLCNELKQKNFEFYEIISLTPVKLSSLSSVVTLYYTFHVI